MRCGISEQTFSTNIERFIIIIMNITFKASAIYKSLCLQMPQLCRLVPETSVSHFLFDVGMCGERSKS